MHAWAPGGGGALEAERRLPRERLVAWLARRQAPTARFALVAPCLALLGFGAGATSCLAHLRLHSIGELSRAVQQGLRGAGAGKPSFPEAAWSWLGSLAEVQFLAPQTRIVAGVELAQVRVDGSAEPGALCEYSGWNFIWDAISTGGTPSEVLSPAACHHSSSDRVWLHWALQRDSAEYLIQTMRRSWEQNATSRHNLRVRLLAYSAAADCYVLYSLFLGVDPSGLPISKTSLVAFDAEPVWLNFSADWGDSRWPLLILDVAFVVTLVVFVTARLAWRMCRCRRSNGSRTCVRICPLLCFSLESAIDWSVLLTLASTVTLYTYWSGLINGLKGLLQELPVLDQHQRHTLVELEALLAARASTWQEYTQQLEVSLEQAQRAADVHSEVLCCAVVLVVFIVLCLCGAFRASPRLDVVLRTLQISPDLAHLLVVFSAVLMVFVLSGHVIYGAHIEMFSTFGGALGSTLLFLMGHAFDSVERDLRETGGAIGIAWTWLFGSFWAIALLSWVTVFILEGYMGARAQAGKGPAPSMRACCGFRQRRTDAGELCALAQEMGLGAEVPEDKAERRRAAAEAAAEFSERRVLERLQSKFAHPSAAVSPASLARELGAETWAARAQLGGLLALAVREAPPGQLSDAVDLNDAVRLMAQIDARVQELGRCIKPLSGHLPAASAGGEDPTTQVAGKEEELPIAGFPAGIQDISGPEHNASAACDLEILRSGSPTPTCTDDFECEDLEPPPSLPSEGSDDDGEQVGPLALADLEDMLVSGELAISPVPGSAAVRTLSGAASPCADNLELQDLAPPPSPPPDVCPGIQPVADWLEALERSGDRRCGSLREHCASLECRIVSAADQMEGSVALQTDALLKLESTFDQIIHGVAPLFAPA